MCPVPRAVALTATLAAGAALTALAGCRQTANLSKQEVVVQFTLNATQADHARVWNLCQHVDGSTPEPLVTTSSHPSTLMFNVRYRVDHASNYQLQQLYDCLRQDATVVGFRPGDNSDN
jgi:hypothetical protein